MRSSVFGVALVLLLASGAASADIITYSLSNKDRGVEALPDYGLRVDGLFGVRSSISPNIKSFSMIKARSRALKFVRDMTVTGSLKNL